ncbi:MAG TPA: hypothetical protein VH601_02665 [Bryobacteraceae bacterium]|jgi:hypothetical protein
MTIEKIECLQSRAPNANPADFDGSTETVVIPVIADNQVTGIGEADARPNIIPAVLQMLSADVWNLSTADFLSGKNPLEALCEETVERCLTRPITVITKP